MPKVGTKSKSKRNHKVRKKRGPALGQLKPQPGQRGQSLEAAFREVMSDGLRTDRRREARQKANNIIVKLSQESYERRTALEENDYAWLMYYAPAMFDKPWWWDEDEHTWRDLLELDYDEVWTGMRKGLVEDINFVGEQGGYTCSAAYRGGGKTSIAEGMTLKGIVEGKYKYVGVVAANGPFAENIMNDIKAIVEDSETFIEDYPEVSKPVIGMEGALNRAMTQTVNGHRTKMKWSGNKVVFPTVVFEIEGFEGEFTSRASGSLIQCRGFDAPMRGMKSKGYRLDLLIIDDPDETGETDDKTDKKIIKLEGELANLGGDKRELAVIMLCNTPKDHSIGNIYANAQIKPEWRGKRYPFCTARPDDLTLSREYVERRKEELRKIALSDNPLALPRDTDVWFANNWEVIHAGYEFDNPERFFKQNGIDGNPKEFSALHRYLNAICKTNEQSVLMEFDLTPPKVMDPDADGFTALWFAERQNELGELTALPNSDFYNITVDCGKYELHYKIVSWVKQKGVDQAKSHVLHRGSVATGITKDMTQGIEILFFAALCELYDDLMMYEVRTPSGRVVPLGKYGVDAGYLPDMVYGFKREKASPKIVALMGTHDDNTPKDHSRLRNKESKDVKMGLFQEYRLKKIKGGGKVWLKLINTTYWKTWVRNRWSTKVGHTGCRTIWKEEQLNNHLRWGEHMANPKWDEEKKIWVTLKHKADHWSDCDYYDAALAAEMGVRLPLKKKDELEAIEQVSPQTVEQKKQKYARPKRRPKQTMQERMAR